MTYLYRVLHDGPIAFYSMSSSALTDYSGYSNTGSLISGTTVLNRPIVAKGIGCQQYTGIARTNHPVPNLMTNGKENQSFSLEFWYKPENITGTSVIFARNSSGVFHTSSGLSFTIDFTGMTLSATYNGLENGNPYHIVAVYDTRDMYLYVNGEVVASAPVTTAHLAATIADLSAALRIQNSGSSGHSFSVDSAAVYNYALNANAVQSHYNWGTDYPNVAEISGRNNADVYRIYDGNTNLKSRFQIDTAEEWNSGAFSGMLAVVEDSLTQQFDTTNSIYYDGVWTYSVFLPQETGVTLSGSRITWDANITNLDVKTSINGGTTFTTMTNGGSPFNNLSVSAAEQELIVKVTLPAGATAIVVPSITIAVYIDKDIFGTNEDVPLLITNETTAVVSEYDYEPASFNSNLGMKFTSLTSGFTLPLDAEFGAYQSIEFLMHIPSGYGAKTLLTAGAATITTDASGYFVGTGLTGLYIDGISRANGAQNNLSTNQVHHVIAVFPSVAGPIYLGNSAAMSVGIPNLSIGYVATYSNTITSAQAASIYGAWVGAAATQWKEANKTNIVEHIYPDSAAAMRGYAYTWAISGSTG